MSLLEVWELPAASNFLLLSSILRQVEDLTNQRMNACMASPHEVSMTHKKSVAKLACSPSLQHPVCRWSFM